MSCPSFFLSTDCLISFLHLSDLPLSLIKQPHAGFSSHNTPKPALAIVSPISLIPGLILSFDSRKYSSVWALSLWTQLGLLVKPHPLLVTTDHHVVSITSTCFRRQDLELNLQYLQWSYWLCQKAWPNHISLACFWENWWVPDSKDSSLPWFVLGILFPPTG